MVDFGGLPSNGRKDFTYTVTDIAHVHINLGASFWYESSEGLINAGYKKSSTFVFGSYIDYVSLAGENRIIIKTNNEEANIYSALICLEYTKNTDQNYDYD